jgi:hypothetical protein
VLIFDRSVALSAADRVIQSKTALVGEVDGQVVALDVESGHCFGLNSIGSEIWRRIETEIVVRDLCRQLCDAYDVDYAQCEVDVLGLLEDLRSEGMIEVR